MTNAHSADLSVVIAYIDDLETRLSAARAGYLDNLNNAALLNLPDLSTLTAAQIAKIDNLDKAISALNDLAVGDLHNLAQTDILDTDTPIDAKRLDAYLNQLKLFIGDFVYSKSFDVSPQDIVPTDLAFNTDGTKMFVTGIIGDGVYEYNLGTGFDVSTAVYSQMKDVSAQDGDPQAVAFNSDGTKMFIVGSQNDSVYEYNLGTGFDVSTAVYVDAFDVSAQDGDPNGIAFNIDGTKMFIVGKTNDSVYEYNLGTGFDVSTAVYSKTFSVVAQDNVPTGLFFNLLGTKMFVAGQQNDSLYEYNLGTGFDVSTAVYSQMKDVSAQDANPSGIAFNPLATKMFMVGSTSDAVHEYT